MITTSPPLWKKPSPGKQDMRTPRWLFERLSYCFGPFALDAAASAENALCSKFFDGSTPNLDGLLAPWIDVTFCNPPFRDAGEWVRKAIAEAKRGARSVLIVPVGCSQSWWHEAAAHATIFYPTKRISFDLPDGTPTTGADRDTLILIFDSGQERVTDFAGWSFDVRGEP